jgi:hypothetical protein
MLIARVLNNHFIFPGWLQYYCANDQAGEKEHDEQGGCKSSPVTAAQIIRTIIFVAALEYNIEEIRMEDLFRVHGWFI